MKCMATIDFKDRPQANHRRNYSSIKEMGEDMDLYMMWLYGGAVIHVIKENRTSKPYEFYTTNKERYVHSGKRSYTEYRRHYIDEFDGMLQEGDGIYLREPWQGETIIGEVFEDGIPYGSDYGTYCYCHWYDYKIYRKRTENGFVYAIDKQEYLRDHRHKSTSPTP